MPDRLWPEGDREEQFPFAPFFAPVEEAHKKLTAGFGLFRDVHGNDQGEESMRVVGCALLPSFPGVHPWLFLQACAPAELHSLEQQLNRPDRYSGLKRIVVEVLLGPTIDSDREREILESLGLTVEEAQARCSKLKYGL